MAGAEAGGRRASYLELAASGELHARARRLEAMLADCTVCPHACHVDRHEALGVCATGAEPNVASWTPHFGEEPVISGRRGSGTVFLSGCNLRCVFCQNHEISQGSHLKQPHLKQQWSQTIEGLAQIFLDLQRRGCHNINWVSPSHQVPQLVQALDLATDDDLSIPVVYNSNGYDSVEVLSLLDGLVDVFMPDLKYASAETAAELSGATDYPRRARKALREMLRQVGDSWQLGPDGTLVRGLLVRILVLPNDLAEAASSLQWIAEELSPRVGISLMAQYYPTHLAPSGRFPLLERTISAGEWMRALEALERFMEGDHHHIQEHCGAAEYYRPDFSDPEVPFKDISDFTGDGEPR